VLNLGRLEPASDRPADIAAYQRKHSELYNLFLDPIYKGIYPAELMDWIGTHQPKIQQGDLQTISQPIDFLGVNYYSTELVSHALSGGLLKAESHPFSAPGWGRTSMGWGVNPPGLGAVLIELKENFGNPAIFVTENGTALEDAPGENGFVADWGRVNYLRTHLQEVYNVIQKGANVKGYYTWSLMDNFEWSSGYRPRFGIVRVDYESLKRTPKQSALWYSQVIAENAITI